MSSKLSMGGGNICEQCKAHAIPPRSPSRTPCGSTSQSSSSRTPCPLPTPTNPTNKAVYVHIDPGEKTCIVFNKDECRGGQGSISLKFPVKAKCGQGGGNNSSGGCIEIVGNSIIRANDAGLQIVPCNKKGTMQISLGRGGCGPVLQVGSGSSRSCGTKSR